MMAMMHFAGELPAMTRLTMGTGGVTDPANPECVAVARMAMEAGVWFHVSDYGGGVYSTLRQAFSEDPAHIPHCIFKVDGTSVDGFRASVEDALRRTGIERIDIGQVCGNPVGEELAPLAEALVEMKERGLIGCYIMDVIRPYSAKVMQAVQDDLFAGYIFYYNVVERQLSNEANALLEARHTPVLAMRTFGGRDGGNYLLLPETDPKWRALEPLYQRSGCANRTEFCVRFPLSLPDTCTTIGSTGSRAHLQTFLDAGASFTPLAPEVVDGIKELIAEWDK
ncbi:MAG: aldo-keto reductase family protein [Armatimonadota bacterium]